MNVDWSKAPARATHAVRHGDRIEFVWAKFPDGGGIASFHAADDPDATRTDFHMARSGWEIVSCRDTYPTCHQVPYWSGEGLPPVGTVCEVDGSAGPTGWGECTIRYVSDDVIVFKRAAYGFESFSPIGEDSFRPIRTPEQIAAEERDRIVEIMRDVVKERLEGEVDANWSYTYNVLQALYDNGYRKEVKS